MCILFLKRHAKSKVNTSKTERMGHFQIKKMELKFAYEDLGMFRFALCKDRLSGGLCLINGIIKHSFEKSSILLK